MKFLHRVDVVENRIMRVETDLVRLRKASFLDGREQFWTDQSVEDGAPFLASHAETRACKVAWIFHVGFCGSTLLTRLLESAKDTLSLREPQCLVDLSDQLVRAREEGKLQKIERWSNAIPTHFSGLSSEHGKIIVKPSNWANPLLPMLEAQGAVGDAIFVTMERKAWLRACLRGGRDRLAYVARCADHTARATGLDTAIVQSAITGTSDPLDQAVRLAALLHKVQDLCFDRADPTSSRRLDYDEIVSSPLEAVNKARKLLGLRPNPSLEIQLDWHAKDPNRRFDPSIRENEDKAVETEHAGRIKSASDWVEVQSIEI